jgi:hypothetical protein
LPPGTEWQTVYLAAELPGRFLEFLLYRKSVTLFGDEADEKIEQSGRRLVKWYCGRLKEAFGFASNAALIRNTRGGHLYYLMLASLKATGVKIADHILGAGDTV